MTIQDKSNDGRPHFRRAKRLAVWVSLVAASWILFLIYGYNEETYQRIPFWEVRVPVFVAIFIVAFIVLRLRSRRVMRTDSPEK